MLTIQNLRERLRRLSPSSLAPSSVVTIKGSSSSLTKDVWREIIRHFDDLNDHVNFARTSAIIRSFYAEEEGFWRRACMAAGYGIPTNFRSIGSWEMLAAVICIRLRQGSLCHWYTYTKGDAICPVDASKIANACITGVGILPSGVKFSQGTKRKIHPISYDIEVPDSYGWIRGTTLVPRHDMRDTRSSKPPPTWTSYYWIPPVFWAVLLPRADQQGDNSADSTPSSTIAGTMTKQPMTLYDLDVFCQNVVRKNPDSADPRTLVADAIASFGFGDI